MANAKKQLEVSDEVAIQITKMNKWFGSFHVLRDIDLKVKGKSFNIFRSNKIVVKRGLLKKDIKFFYEPYFFNRTNKIPYTTGKIAISKNNIISTNINNIETNNPIFNTNFFILKLKINECCPFT